LRGLVRWGDGLWWRRRLEVHAPHMLNWMSPMLVTVKVCKASPALLPTTLAAPTVVPVSVSPHSNEGCDGVRGGAGRAGGAGGDGPHSTCRS
jgi:hypothetical protein